MFWIQLTFIVYPLLATHHAWCFHIHDFFWSFEKKILFQLRHKPKPGGQGGGLAGKFKFPHLTSRAFAFHYRLILLGLHASIFLTLGRQSGLSRNAGCLRHLCPGRIVGHFESRSERTPNELMFLKCFELLREQKLFNSGLIGGSPLAPGWYLG